MKFKHEMTKRPPRSYDTRQTDPARVVVVQTFDPDPSECTLGARVGSDAQVYSQAQRCRSPLATKPGRVELETYSVVWGLVLLGLGSRGGCFLKREKIKKKVKEGAPRVRCAGGKLREGTDSGQSSIDAHVH